MGHAGRRIEKVSIFVSFRYDPNSPNENLNCERLHKGTADAAQEEPLPELLRGVRVRGVRRKKW